MSLKGPLFGFFAICLAIGGGVALLIGSGYQTTAGPGWLPFHVDEGEQFLVDGAQGNETAAAKKAAAEAAEQEAAEKAAAEKADAEAAAAEKEAAKRAAAEKAAAATTTTVVTKVADKNTTTTVPADTAAVIQVTEPADGSVHTEKIITFHGTSEPGSTVNVGPYVATIDEDGNWEITLTLSPGPNKITFAVTDPSGNTAAHTITVMYDAPAPATTTTTEAATAPIVVEFSANQKYGSCSDPEPYDKFFGTAPIGSTITLESDFGSATTVSDQKGHWFKKLYFNGPPADVPFDVKVTGINGSQVFSFVYQPPQIPETPEDVEFSAFQTYGVGTLEWPKDWFHGTATPGTTVSITASFEDLSWAFLADVDIWGNWGETKAWFEGLPPQKEIAVTVSAENGSQTFSFIHIPAAG